MGAGGRQKPHKVSFNDGTAQYLDCGDGYMILTHVHKNFTELKLYVHVYTSKTENSE